MFPFLKASPRKKGTEEHSIVSPHLVQLFLFAPSPEFVETKGAASPAYTWNWILSDAVEFAIYIVHVEHHKLHHVQNLNPVWNQIQWSINKCIGDQTWSQDEDAQPWGWMPATQAHCENAVWRHNGWNTSFCWNFKSMKEPWEELNHDQICQLKQRCFKIPQNLFFALNTWNASLGRKHLKPCVVRLQTAQWRKFAICRSEFIPVVSMGPLSRCFTTESLH